MGRLAGTGIKLKGRLTLEFDKDVDVSQLIPLLTQSPAQPENQSQASNFETLLPLFPQPYLSSPSEKRGNKIGYQSPDRYPVSGGLFNKGEGVTSY